jgi:hypothetical protein
MVQAWCIIPLHNFLSRVSLWSNIFINTFIHQLISIHEVSVNKSNHNSQRTAYETSSNNKLCNIQYAFTVYQHQILFIKKGDDM